jgi:hypothetical protein
MLNKVCHENKVSVYVYGESKSCVVENFLIDDLFFVVFDSGSWGVDCDGKSLLFSGVNFVKFV